jgi:hypothetical protein
MKLALCILGVLCFFAAVAHGQKEKPRRIFDPVCYYNAESFVELSESNREVYTTGLMDGSYGSALFGASNETVASLSSCAKHMDSKQVTAIITKYVKDHP